MKRKSKQNEFLTWLLSTAIAVVIISGVTYCQKRIHITWEEPVARESK